MDCVKAAVGRNCAFDAGSALAAESPYEVKWIPDTIFQLALIRATEQLIWSVREVEETSHKFKKFYPEREYLIEVNTDLDVATSLQEFLDACVAIGHVEIFDHIYVITLKWFNARYKDCADFEGLAEEIIKTPSYMKPNDYYCRGKSMKLEHWVGEMHIPIIKAYVGHELRAITRSEFILTRGNREREIFEIPESGYSLSYGQRILDGSFQDLEARSLSYLFDYRTSTANPGYMLLLSMSEYMDGLFHRLRHPKDKGNMNLFNLIYLPPLSSISSFFACDEVFHPRSKANDEGTHSPPGYHMGVPYNLMALDRESNLSIFRERFFSKHEITLGMSALLTKAEMVYEGSPDYANYFNAAKAAQLKWDEDARKILDPTDNETKDGVQGEQSSAKEKHQDEKNASNTNYEEKQNKGNETNTKSE